MHNLGSIYCSGPSHAAANNFATRLDEVSQRVTDRFNSGRNWDSRRRHRLILRAYNLNDEFKALLSLLENPNMAHWKELETGWTAAPDWSLHLSLTYWVLYVLDSPLVKRDNWLDDDGLDAVRKQVKESQSFQRLRAVAVGQVS